MKINIGHLIKYSFLLAHVLASFLVYYYSQTSTDILPALEPLQSLPPNQGASVGSATVVGPFVPPRPKPKPDVNEVIMKFYAGFLSVTSVGMMIKKVRQGYRIPIHKMKKLRLVNRFLTSISQKARAQFQ